MNYRHELKFELNFSDYLIIRQRLKLIMKYDSHTTDGKYHIRSLYFDNLDDKALREKIDGVNKREKFRIRYYNGNTDVIHLEKKSKLNGLGSKESAPVTKEDSEKLLSGDLAWMLERNHPLLKELYSKMTVQGLRPKTIVDYDREAYVYAPGNVRITFDTNVRTGLASVDFLNPDCVTVPAGEKVILMEVKWDGFFPEIIKDAIWLDGRSLGSFSKYEHCRIYG